MKKIVIASDHAGFDLKNIVKSQLTADNYEIYDVGTYTKDSCDYPIFAEKACKYLLDGNADLCILICGTGIGMSIAANKIKGIRAACCSDTYSAKYTRLHNDANTLCMGARVIGEGLAYEIAKIFLETEFEGGKHQRRVNLISEIENNN
jgi:ribose 5-phosphate isomerase B